MANIIAKSGKAVEVAGDIDTLLLDKTGTITIGNRRATQFVPLGGASPRELARLAGAGVDGRPDARGQEHPRAGPAAGGRRRRGARPAPTFVEFTAQTRMSGIDLPDGTQTPQGCARHDRAGTSSEQGGPIPDGYQATVDAIASQRRDAAGRRRQRPASSAWSSSKTSSSRASASGSPGSARWACGS